MSWLLADVLSTLRSVFVIGLVAFPQVTNAETDRYLFLLRNRKISQARAELKKRPAGYRESLIAGLKAPEPAVRAECVRIVNSVFDDSFVPHLQALSKDPVQEVRELALNTLSEHANSRRVGWLGVFLNDESTFIRAAAVVGYMTHKNDAQTFAMFSNDKQVLVRLVAMEWRCVKEPSVEFRGHALAGLNDEDSHARRAAAGILAFVGAPEDVPALQAVSQRSDETAAVRF